MFIPGLSVPAVCSGCVRSSIEYQERSGPASCPQCRDRCDTADLRPAPQLRAVAAAFLAARPLLLVRTILVVTGAPSRPCRGRLYLHRSCQTQAGDCAVMTELQACLCNMPLPFDSGLGQGGHWGHTGCSCSSAQHACAGGKSVQAAEAAARPAGTELRAAAAP